MANFRQKTATVAPSRLDVSYSSSSVDYIQDWQQQSLYYDESCGMLGNAADLIAAIAQQAEFKVKFVNNKDNPLLEGLEEAKAFVPVVAFSKDLTELVFDAVRIMFLIGEFYFVNLQEDNCKFVNCKPSYGWCVLNIGAVVDNAADKKYKRFSLGSDCYVDVLNQYDDGRDNLVRVIRSNSREVFEAFSPVKRVLSDLDSLVSISTSQRNIIKSNAVFPNIIVLPKSEAKTLAPVAGQSTAGGGVGGADSEVAGMMQLAKDQMAGKKQAPFTVLQTNGNVEVIKLSIPIDPNFLATKEDTVASIALGLNIPTRVLTGEGGNHWSDWLLDDDLKTFAVKPILDIVVKHFSMMYESNSRFKPVLTYSFPQTQSIDVDKALEGYKAGIVGSSFVRKSLKAEEADKPDAADLQFLSQNILKSSTDRNTTS